MRRPAAAAWCVVVAVVLLAGCTTPRSALRPGSSSSTTHPVTTSSRAAQAEASLGKCGERLIPSWAGRTEASTISPTPGHPAVEFVSYCRAGRWYIGERVGNTWSRPYFASTGRVGGLDVVGTLRMLPKALPVALVGVFPGANDILYALFTTIRGRVQPVVVAGAPHRASLALVSAAYAGGGAGFSCSNTDLFGPLRIVQYQYQMSIGATTAQVASTIYTATSPGTMKESKGPTITVKATFAEALGLTGC